MRSLPYSILDVFAEHPLQGNPIALFHDATALSTQDMQALARETNLAETAFILPAPGETSTVRVRIFTTREESPFAGHPTLGAASWLYWNHPHLRGSASITLALHAGPITVRLTPPSSGEQGLRGQMRQHDPVFGNTHDPGIIAALLGLSAEDLPPGHTPQTISTGLPFCIVPLRSLAVAQRLQVAQRESQQYFASSDAKLFYCVAPVLHSDRSDGPHFHARMQDGFGKCSSAAAPSPWHHAPFSCRDLPVSHRHFVSNANINAGLSSIRGSATRNPANFRLNFAVASAGTRAYSRQIVSHGNASGRRKLSPVLPTI